MKKHDYKSGEKYARLTFISPVNVAHPSGKWILSCDCGNNIQVPAISVE